MRPNTLAYLPQLIDQLTKTCTYSTYILGFRFTDIFAYLSQLVN